MKITLLSYTRNADDICAAAGRSCYSDKPADEILGTGNPEKTLSSIIGMGHKSVIEHAVFTFSVSGVSRSLTHQLVRHRIASFSQQSQRYVKLENFEYIIPPSIENDPAAKAIFIEAMEKDTDYYNKLVDILYEKHLQRYLEEGLSEKKSRNKAEKEAIEDSRYVFPNACETKIIFTMNARVLLNFFRLRTCNRAQWEIRELAIEMLRKVQAVYPTLFKDAGPGCVKGACPEGSMTCGKIVEVRERFKGGL